MLRSRNGGQQLHGYLFKRAHGAGKTPTRCREVPSVGAQSQHTVTAHSRSASKRHNHCTRAGTARRHPLVPLRGTLLGRTLRAGAASCTTTLACARCHPEGTERTASSVRVVCLCVCAYVMGRAFRARSLGLNPGGVGRASPQGAESLGCQEHGVLQHGTTWPRHDGEGAGGGGGGGGMVFGVYCIWGGGFSFGRTSRGGTAPAGRFLGLP